MVPKRELSAENRPLALANHATLAKVSSGQKEGKEREEGDSSQQHDHWEPKKALASTGDSSLAPLTFLNIFLPFDIR